MEVIHLNVNSTKPFDLPPLSIALGYFDGIHKGHQKVINKAVELAKVTNTKSAVMTFFPHPSVVLNKEVKHVSLLTPMDEKIEKIKNLGVDYLFIVEFSREFASLEPEKFVDLFLIAFNVKNVVAGFDYSYGFKGQGTMQVLPIHGKGNFETYVIEKFTEDEIKVSSTRIRQLLKEGNVKDIPSLLGERYKVRGTVIHGDKRGRTIGFPTANIKLKDDYIIPAIGVYSVQLMVNNEWYNGICNIGLRPTFKDNELVPTIEVYLFDFNSDIYDQEVEIRWFDFLRHEQKFNGIEELVNQLNTDKQQALQFFKNLTVNS